ncbi:PEP-CTERM sorting domain-containing protein [Sphingomonas sp. MA1305]|uniref:PEPxxWA-CTERM sorting domain-containing protein n=1 Tax=Sphingomonas sp. MA1305 TaxID=2479204 RepID=UPI0018DF732A|nr:PEPxxWA-CTERM sorting domain-containing protein [Sphingomonas sp. MA1305]MBI0475219.1 PEP-CTERM sorting domain-containing protein [Sphingomonas sp. MA1305]
MKSKFVMAIVSIATSASASQAIAADVLNPGNGAPYALTSNSYTQDFNSLKSITSSPTPADALPDGWQTFESGSAANGTYQFGTSGSNTPGVWSFGLTSDRALGGHASTSVPLIYIGALFENGLGSTIDALDISYTGEQWQKGYNRATMRFQYSLDATDINSGTWLSFGDLDFTAPNSVPYAGSQFGITQTNGNATAYRTSLNGVLSGLSIGAGSTFGIRWVFNDIDPAGVTSDDGLGVDDFRLTASTAAVPEPATWAMMILGMAAVGLAMRSKKRPAAGHGRTRGAPGHLARASVRISEGLLPG